MNKLPQIRARRRGAALLLVLGALILVSAILIGFLATVRRDKSTSSFYEGGAGARQFADMAVNVVTAQIAEATATPSETWISQPGLLRTYTASGPVAAYKLFSSDAMKVPGAYNPETEAANEVPTTWFSQPDRFVDLNLPVSVTTSGSTQLVYPIVDPDAVNEVEGFSVDNTKVSTPAVSDPKYNVLPMPVRWMYVRADGSLVNYDTAATADDIVARVAFWTDDETCKVNVNTASDGVYYDAPAYYSKQDYWLGITQPVAQEYQRFPGHPSNTSLSAVLKGLRNIPEDTLTMSGAPSVTVASTRSQIATAITPRISSISMNDPTKNTGGSNGAQAMAWLTKNPILPDSDRLMASVDEISYQKDQTTRNWNSASGDRQPAVAALPTLGTLNTKPLQFFLTTRSRAPELNLLNRPRITLWPFNKELVQSATDWSGLTPEDRLIRLASEIGSNKRKLYFQREDAWDPLNDYANIQENKDLYSYLQWMTKQPMPAANSARATSSDTLESKYTSAGRDQILTEMFDYLRSEVNTSNFAYAPVNGPVYSFPQKHAALNGANPAGFNDICPLVFTPNGSSTATKGLGTTPVLSEVILQFYNAGEYLEGQTISTGAWNSYGVVSGTSLQDPPAYVVRRIRMVCLLNLIGLTNNLNSANGRFQVRVTGTPLGLSSSGVQMRLLGDTVWSNTLPSIGFPDPSMNTTLVCSQGGDWAAGGLKGETYRLSWPLTFPTSSSLTDTMNTSAMKTLANSQSTLDFPGYVRYGDGQTINGLGLKYQIYPFVSRIVEIRIPYTKSGRTTADISPFDIGTNPFVDLIGTDLNIDILPGLKNVGGAYQDDFNINAPNFTLYDPISTAPLASTRVQILGGSIPLPLLGGAGNSDNIGYDGAPVAYWPRNLTHFAAVGSTNLSDFSRKDLQYYPNRFRRGDKRILFSISSGNVPYDVVRSYHLDGNANSYGDLRLAGMRTSIPSSWWRLSDLDTSSNNFVQTSVSLNGNDYSRPPKLGRFLKNQSFSVLARNTTGSVNGVFRKNSGGSVGTLGDFTVGYGSFPGGAAVLGPDVGAVSWGFDINGNAGPYYANEVSRVGNQDTSNAAFVSTANYTGINYSPFKQIPSPVMFGTLPSRVLDDPPSPWETLLFCPNPSGGKDTHRGWTQLPRDHYWLDLFYMPVVEPYAITENFATNGKINLNSQISPFTYIKRNTGLYALLRNTQISAVPDGDSANFKPIDGAAKYQGASSQKYRLRLDVAETLKGFDARIANNDPFVSPSEICEMFLVPQGSSYGSIESFWSDKNLTGDDKKEAPYNSLYPRVTTRSNTFKVFFIAQTLKGKAGKWAVTGQYRGSQVVERYLDIASRVYGAGSAPDTEFPPLAGNDANGVPYYRFRKLEHRQFSP